MASSRRQFIEKDLTFSLNSKCFDKPSLSPTSTVDSQSPRDYYDTLPKPCCYQNKEKSQLCKKFV